MAIWNSTKTPRIPRLENGDHLSAEEFLERYEAMPGLKKAELIDGVVCVPSPTRWNLHASPHGAMSSWLTCYWAHTPGVQCGDSGTIKLDMKNVPQPDVALMVLPAHGGQAKVDKDDYMTGAPELVAEVSSSSKSIDLNSKLRLYLRHHVREYIVWRVEDEAIDWFIAPKSDLIVSGLTRMASSRAKSFRASGSTLERSSSLICSASSRS